MAVSLTRLSCGLATRQRLTLPLIAISLSLIIIKIHVTHTLIQNSHSFLLCLGVVGVRLGELLWYSVLV